MKALVERAIALRIDHQLKAASPARSSRYYCTMAPPSRCTGVWRLTFPGRFKTISPAAIECHMTMSLSEQSPLCMVCLPIPQGSGNFSLRLTQAGQLPAAG